MNDGTGLKYLPSTGSGRRLTNHLGSVVAITDSTGTLISQQRYLPFGGVRADVPSPNAPSTDFGYTGQRSLDSGMGGLMDYKARFYSPYLNHFIQPDSIIPNPSNSQAWNRYSYVMNRPVNFNDPTGHVGDGNSSCGVKKDQCGTRTKTPPPNVPVEHPHGGGGGDDSGGAAVSGFVTPPTSNYPGDISGISSGVAISNLPSINIPPFNANIPTLYPIGIYGDDPTFYVSPFAVKITTQPSFTFNNGSPITIGPGRPAGIITNRNGRYATNLSLNSDLSSNFGIVSFDQLNDAVTHSSGVGIPTWLAPQELSLTFTNSTAIDIPNTDLSVSMNVPVTVSMRYNPTPLGVAAITVAAVAFFPAKASPQTSVIVSGLCEAAFQISC